jgi:hypothetical protein
MKMLVKNADNNNNINKPARIGKYCFPVRFSDIDYTGSHEEGFLWLLHMISVFYIVKSETRVKNGRESNISRQPKHLPKFSPPSVTHR